MAFQNTSTRLLVVLAALASAAAQGVPVEGGTAHAGTTTGCANNCQLNGECKELEKRARFACVCDKGWTGADCGLLDLDPEPVIAYGYGASTVASTSSWGGGPPAYDAATETYHLFVSEIAGNCGMTCWSRMSQSVHAVSKKREGPYTRVSTVVGTESHNTYYQYSAPDKKHLIYHIFDGRNPESCAPWFPCTNGSTPNGTGHGLRPPPNWPGPTTCPPTHTTTIHYADSLDGPWSTAGPITFDYGKGFPPHGGTSNPAPYIFPNGTVIMLSRGKDAGVDLDGKAGRSANHNVVLFRAESWNATYTWVPSNGVNGTAGIGNGQVFTEDPVLWRGRRGFHALFHSSPDLTHGWSFDGVSWDWSPTIIGPPRLAGDNERPRVSVDDDGDLAVVYVGQLCGPGDASRTAAFTARAPPPPSSANTGP